MADKTYESLKIENIVASGVISGPIDLVKFSENVEHCELNKKTVPRCSIPDPGAQDCVPGLFVRQDRAHRHQEP